MKIALVRDDTAKTIRNNAIANGEYGFNVPEDAIPGTEYRVRIEKISFQKTVKLRGPLMFCSNQSLKWSSHIVQKDVPRSRLSFT